MRTTRQMLIGAASALLLCLTFVGSAFATNWYPYNLGTLTSYLDGEKVGYKDGSLSGLSGDYSFSALAFESVYDLQLRNSVGTLFKAHDLSAANVGTSKLSDIGTTYFYDNTNKDTWQLTDTSRVHVYELTSSWTLANGNVLSAGTLILGMNDRYTGDKDFEDFVVSASKPAATPVPAAVWMLGSGVLALMGYRRVRPQPESN